MTQGLVSPAPFVLVSCPFSLLTVINSQAQGSSHLRDCAPSCREEPWVSSGFEHGVHGAGESSLQLPGRFSL